MYAVFAVKLRVVARLVSMADALALLYSEMI